MFALKSYQERAVNTLQEFLTQCREQDSAEVAFRKTLKNQDQAAIAYRDQGFGNIPYACFRIPTGGGKTVLGSHAIRVTAKEYLDQEYPIALWLVPTNTIRQQTVEALKKPEHPYREALDGAFRHRVMVLDIDEVTQIRPHDLGSKAIIVVSTLANLRVSDTSGRRVYAYHENFEPHFTKLNIPSDQVKNLDRVSEVDLQENGLTRNALGNIKYSFANLLALHRPIVIVDEAHNARTNLTFETLRRIHPAAVIEFTATPNLSATNGSNILFHVSAAELKAEQMIKLPIVLTEHDNWEGSVRDAVISRNRLAIEAQKDDDYIRPIALFQAEPKNGKVTVEVLRNYLINDLKISTDKIAIVTGTQRELDDIDLFSPACPIEYIITIEALKEGWDCSFAYVFCSVKQVSSSKDAEQLLGRVLRMPYAKRRLIADLNKAYAHLSTTGFSQAAHQLTDKLIAMGFEEIEVASLVQEQTPVEGQRDLFGETDQPAAKPSIPSSVVFEVSEIPDFSSIREDDRSKISITSLSTGNSAVRVEGEISTAIEKAVASVFPKKPEKEKLQRDVRIHNQRIQALKAPSEKGAKFGSLPMLCLDLQGELELIEPETFLHTGAWNLLDYPAELKSFTLNDHADSFSVDVDGNKVVYRSMRNIEQESLNDGFIDVEEGDVVRWLDRELRQPDIPQNQLIKFCQLVVRNLLKNTEITLTGLVRNKFPLARAIKALIASYRKQAQRKGYQDTLFGQDNLVRTDNEFRYDFNPLYYPSRPPYYSGRYQFTKHYFPHNQIEDLKATGEEFECAQIIDCLEEVEYWIRNLVRREHASFWLPLSDRKFYPDFVCRLKDGRMLVVEYKGEAYSSNDDSVEKRAIGELWESQSEGSCLFVMATNKDQYGRGTKEQIKAAIQKA